MNRKNVNETILNLLLYSLIFTFPFASKINIIDFGFLNLYAYRIFLLLAIIYLGVTKQIFFPRYRLNKWLLLFIVWLFLYGLLSLLWVENQYLAWRQISHVLWGGFTFIVIFSLSYKVKNSLGIVKDAWLSAYIILAVFAIYEIGSGAHFEGTFTKNLEQFDSIRTTFNSPFSTFGNPNDYAAFLVFSLIFFFLRLARPNRILPLFFILMTVFIIYYTRSVIAMYGVYWVILASLFLLFYSNNQKIPRIQLYFTRKLFGKIKKNFISIIYISFLLLFGFIYSVCSNPIVFPADNDEVKYVQVEKSKEGISVLNREMFDFYLIEREPSVNITKTQSYSVRKNLILNGLTYAKESWFMGIGAGQFEEQILSGKLKYPTMNKSNPHNFFIEVLSQYGIIPIVFLGIFMMSIVVFLIRNFKQLYARDLSMESSMLFLTIPVYLLVSNGPSAFMSLPMNWIILTMMAYSAERLLKNKKHINEAHKHE
jgi:teichuronic acid biosynthesis protein TuaE